MEESHGPRFSDPETWAGGYYELALELGARSDERLLAALQALWALPVLEGCYLTREREPQEQPRLHPSPERLDDPLYGIASLPGGQRVVCTTYAVPEEDGSDWLDLCLPMASLAHVYPAGAYPHGMAGAPPRWEPELDGWLEGIGRAMYAAVPFQLGLIGFEVSGEWSACKLRQEGVPEVRYWALLWPSGGLLAYYPTNRWDE